MQVNIPVTGKVVSKPILIFFFGSEFLNLKKVERTFANDIYLRYMVFLWE